MDCYCINLKSRKDKRAFMKKQAKKFNLNIMFHTVKKHTNPVRGCLESHLQLIQKAKQNNLQYLVILEDDAKFLRMPTFVLPDKFALFYLGGSIKQIEQSTEHYNKAREIWSTHAYVIHSSIYDKVIKDLETYSQEIDRYYVEEIQQNYDCYVAKPLITTQKSGYSDIEEKHVSYDDYTVVNEEPYREAQHTSIDGYQLILDPLDEQNLPKVSIITPTYNRRHIVSLMLNNFKQCSYPAHKLEWIIVDDSSQRTIKDLLPDDNRIKYIRLDVPEPLTVGRKRNIACSHATGEYIVHMDDDDYYPCDSVILRIRALMSNNALCVGATLLGCMNLYNFECYSIGSRASVLAEASMAYKKTFWETKQFREDVYTGEAVHFLKDRYNDIIQLPYDFIMVAFNHGGNITDSLRDGSGSKHALTPLLDKFTKYFIVEMNKYILKTN